MYNTIEYKHKINYKIVQLSQGRPIPGSDTHNVKNVFGLSKQCVACVKDDTHLFLFQIDPSQLQRVVLHKESSAH